MEETGLLTLLMNFVAPFLLGAALAYLLIATRRRREDPAAQNRTDRATEVLYEREDRDRERAEREEDERAEDRRRQRRA